MSTMLNSNNNGTAKHSPATLTAIMLILLAVCVGLAWWLTWGQHVLSNRGGAILREIRQATLSRYWTGDPVMLAMVAVGKNGKAVGWRISTRKVAEDGYTGLNCTRIGRGLYVGRWKLSADALKGQYKGRSIGAVEQPATTIALSEDGKILVGRIGGRNRVALAAKAETSENYIPEGMFPLIIQLVAKSERKTAFKMIFDDMALTQSRVNFTTVTITPRGLGIVEIKIGEQIFTYHLDRSGGIAKIEESQGMVYKTVPLERLIELFPEVKSFAK